jgi:diguanylate cyclase (GGDEF)-like protein
VTIGMKISGPGAPTGAAGIRRTGPAAKAAPAASVAPRQTADTTSVMGIPEAELTPKVRSAIMALMQEVDSLRRELERSKQRLLNLEKLADQDSLTPVINRRAFVRELSRVISYTQRYSAISSLIYFDVNGFKAINDTYGHACGDAALMYVVDVLSKNVRDSDVVGRLGGDEFGVILAQADDRQAREKAAQLARAVAAHPLEWEGKRIRIEVAYGVYNFRQGENATEALAAADREMYAHKKTLKNGDGA